MNKTELCSQFLGLKRPSEEVLLEIDERLSRTWNLQPQDESVLGARSYKNDVCGVSVVHSEKNGLLVVGVTSSNGMGEFVTKAAVSAVEGIYETLGNIYGSCDLKPGWAGRGSVLVFGSGSLPVEDRSRLVEELRPRVISILPYRDFT